MAVMDLYFDSVSMARTVDLKAVLPNDLRDSKKEGNASYERSMKTLILLHGFSGHSGDWLYKSLIQRMAVKYNIAVFMPSGENYFYLDAPGRAYGTYIGEELPAYLRKTFHLSDQAEDTYIGGLSMGGFGAIHTGYAYPETFGGIFAFSSAMIIHEAAKMKEGEATAFADYEYYRSVFGDLDLVEESSKNPETLVTGLNAAGKILPRLYMACGTEDFLLENNRKFHRFLLENKVNNHIYVEDAGAHDWDFWTAHLEQALVWLLEIHESPDK